MACAKWLFPVPPGPRNNASSRLLTKAALGLAAILLLMAQNSHCVLSETRSLLLQGLILLGESPK
jgi:hypothetical protein